MQPSSLTEVRALGHALMTDGVLTQILRAAEVKLTRDPHNVLERLRAVAGALLPEAAKHKDSISRVYCDRPPPEFYSVHPGLFRQWMRALGAGAIEREQEPRCVAAWVQDALSRVARSAALVSDSRRRATDSAPSRRGRLKPKDSESRIAALPRDIDAVIEGLSAVEARSRSRGGGTG